jgi:hypothetical protein
VMSSAIRYNVEVGRKRNRTQNSFRWGISDISTSLEGMRWLPPRAK